MATKAQCARKHIHAEQVSVACQTDATPAASESYSSLHSSKCTQADASLCSQLKRSAGSSSTGVSKSDAAPSLDLKAERERLQNLKRASRTAQNDPNDSGEDKLCVTIQNFSSMDETLCSASKRIRGVSWRIMVMPKQHVVQKKQQKCMGFFLQCVPDRTYSDTWSCQADAEMRLISQKAGVSNFVRKTTHVYSPKENDWGYSCFMTWADILDENQGYIKNDKVILEIIVRADYPKNMMTREEFCRSIDQWFNLANMQMQRGLVDLALEANSQALKFCKDKDAEMKLKLETQKEMLVNRKLLDSINRIESNKDQKTSETLKPTSLKQALTGVQKSMNNRGKNGKRGPKPNQPKSRKGSVAKDSKNEKDLNAEDLTKTTQKTSAPSTTKKGERRCGQMSCRHCTHLQKVALAGLYEEVTHDEDIDDGSQDSQLADESERESYESAGSECAEDEVDESQFADPDSVASYRDGRFVVCDHGEQDDQCFHGSSSSLDQLGNTVTEIACQTEDLDVEPPAYKRERRPAGSKGTTWSAASAVDDPYAVLRDGVEIDLDTDILEYRQMLQGFRGALSRVDKDIPCDPDRLKEAKERLFKFCFDNFSLSREAVEAKLPEIGAAAYQNMLKFVQEAESPESPPLSEQGDPDMGHFDSINDDHITCCLLAGLCTVQTRRVLEQLAQFVKSVGEGVEVEMELSERRNRKAQEKVGQKGRKIVTAVRRHQNGCTGTENSQTTTETSSSVSNSTFSTSGTNVELSTSMSVSSCETEDEGPPDSPRSTDTISLFTDPKKSYHEECQCCGGANEVHNETSNPSGSVRVNERQQDNVDDSNDPDAVEQIAKYKRYLEDPEDTGLDAHLPVLDCERSIKELLCDMGDVKIETVLADKLRQLREGAENDNFSQLLTQLFCYYQSLAATADKVDQICSSSNIANVKKIGLTFNRTMMWTESTKAEVDSLQSNLQRVAESHDEVKKKMDAQMEELGKRCRELEKKNDELEKKIKEDTMSYQEEVVKLTTALKESTKEHNTLKNQMKKNEKRMKQDETKIVTLQSERIELEDKMKQMKKELDQTKKKLNDDRAKSKKERDRDVELLHRKEAELAEKDIEKEKERKEKLAAEEKIRELKNRENKAEKESKKQAAALSAATNRARSAEIAYLELMLATSMSKFDAVKETYNLGLAEVNENLKKARTQCDIDAVRRNITEWKTYGEDLQKMIKSTRSDFEGMMEAVNNGKKSFNQLEIKVPTPPELPRVLRLPPVQVVQPSTPVLHTPTITVPPAGVIGQSRTPQTPRSRVTNSRIDMHSPCVSSTSTASPPTSPAKAAFIPAEEAPTASPWSWFSPVGNLQETIRSSIADSRPYDMWSNPLDTLQVSAANDHNRTGTASWSAQDQQDWRTLAAHQQAYRTAAPPGMPSFFES